MLDKIEDGDLYITHENKEDSNFLNLSEIAISDDKLLLRLKVLKSFLNTRIVTLVVPATSRLRATNRMNLNEYRNQSLVLQRANIRGVIVPSLSDSDKRLSESFQALSNSLNSGNNTLMNLMRYTLIFRYLSNNQILILLSFLEVRVPLNMHFSTQALSSGMKPDTEKYG